ncbi:hypothetical protein [Streptomyces sp. IBSBF 2953]|uniref:hypothetical protein n=1 Tax=Streptomyces TaxID=1883 RepID=UPI002119ECF6|nr:hypothetical protein [Streptomyces scabiei]
MNVSRKMRDRRERREHRAASSGSRVDWAMTHVMTQRLTGANAATWREAQTVAA